MEIDVDQIIVKTTPCKKGRIVGTAKLQYLSLVIKFFTIREGNYENSFGNHLWVVPPSVKNPDGLYTSVIFFENVSIWKRIEAKIITDYLNTQKMTESPDSENLSGEEIEKIDKGIEEMRSK